VIEIEDLHFCYPNPESGVEIEALKGISLVINDGDFVAIMGQNGAGKTTLVKTFIGLMKPTKGVVRVNGKETTKTTIANLAKNIGFVFQNADHQLFCETVEEEIAFAMKNFGFEPQAIEKRISWALKFLNLERYQEASPFLLSGGERKRVALASVLAWDPDTLILDEPTIGQDHGQKEKLYQFIVKMQNQGKTVIIVTHDVEFVAECNPRVVLMAKGTVLADGKAREVLTNPKVLEKASIVLPQIAKVFEKIAPLGLSKNVIEISEAKESIIKAMEKRQK
jgi:energy-coupling factor transport system ATP-binding protein